MDRQTRLGTKIGIGFGLVALVLIGTILFTIIRIMQTDQINSHLAQETMPRLTASMYLVKGISDVMTAERDFILTNNPAYKTIRDNAWDKFVTPNIDTLNQDFGNANSSEVVARITAVVTELRAKLQQLDNQAGKSPAEITAQFYSEIYPSLGEINDLIDGFIKERQSVLFAGLKNMKTQITLIFLTDAGFLLLGLILCILLGIVLTKLITRPIRALVGITDNLAKGDLEQTVNLTEAQEFEQLSQSLTRVITTLNDLANVTERMSEGDYSHRVIIKSEQDKLATSTNKMLDNFTAIINQANAIAEGNYSFEVIPRSEHDILGHALLHMTETLRKNQMTNDEQNWLKDGVAQLANIISDARDIHKMCNDAVSALCRYTNACMGAIYLLNKNENILKLQGSFAFTERDHLANTYKIEEGLIGQVAYENKPIMLKAPKDVQYTVDTGLTQETAKYIYAFPLEYEKTLIGVCELAWLEEPHTLLYQYLDALMPILSSHIQAAQQQLVTEKLLTEQKMLAEKLSTQQEELKATNEELEHQTQVLRASEEELRIKDEEQRKINKQLEDKTQELQQQKDKIESANQALQLASKELEVKADELARASQYKSEFLANMSHELRTPLNSLLILAKLFSDNSDGNLTPDQIESAKIMLKSGQDLLTLINDILDLAKVEAGKIDVYFTKMNIRQMAQHLKSIFSFVAQDKGIDFILEITDNVPEFINTDEQRVTQIVRNLLSNAMKFTSEGHVKLSIYRPQREAERSVGFDITQYLAISVIDTGIGIPEEKQKLVFESFQQADGTTSRKYGGTGLGLSISREFSKLLNAHIRLSSTPGSGSSFTLYLPIAQAATDLDTPTASQPTAAIAQPDTVAPAVPVKAKSTKLKKLLIIEDDKNFANTMITLCRKHGYLSRHVITAEDGLALLDSDLPDIILLDIQLPGMSGFEFLDKIKQNPRTAQIPVQVISSADESKMATKSGAIGYLTKPITDAQLANALEAIEQKIQQNIKTLLIVEDDKNLGEQVAKMIKKNNNDIQITHVVTGQAALTALRETPYDCIILDLGLPDMTGQEVIKEYHRYNTAKNPSIIIYTAKELSKVETEQLSCDVDSIIIKGGTASTERLLEETVTFLEKTHRGEKPSKKSENSGKTILLVDDDQRNLFAIKKILANNNSTVFTETNGKQALEFLAKNPHIDLILMDIMMPVMDGYETIQKIREDANLKQIPIIALTAKALADDRQKCLDAGANDYVTKPIDTDILLKKVEQWIKQTLA